MPQVMQGGDAGPLGGDFISRGLTAPGGRLPQLAHIPGAVGPRLFGHCISEKQ